MKRLIRRMLYFLLFSVLLLAAVIWGINYVVVSSTKNQIYSSIKDIPKNKVGLLLGTAKYTDKPKDLVNVFYQNRIDAAVALYMAGKIDYIIVSGDNSTKYYNEPLLMKEDLMARGVPADRIVMDKHGYRTLDSILRCRDVFGQRKFTIISQLFHNQRAVYIANHKNVETVAFNAAKGDTYWDVTIREKMARVKMAIDLITNKQAMKYGAKIPIE